MNKSSYVGNELVSIIMNCFNSEKYIKQSINSVLNQSYKNWELIIWDNCSEDNTAKIINQINDPRINYFLSPIHTSLGSARNEAIKLSKGKYLSFLDSDDIWLPNKLKTQMNHFRNNQTVNFIYSDHYVINENGKRVFNFNFGKRPTGKILNSFLNKNVIPFTTVIFEASFIKNENNLFDTSLEVAEEFEFFTRILEEYNVSYLKIPLAEYRVYSNMTSKTSYYKYPNEIAYIIKKLKKCCKRSDFSRKEAIRQLELKNIYYKANLLMIKKNRIKASKLLFDIKFESFIFFFLYLLSLFNYRVWNIFHNLINRY